MAQHPLTLPEEVLLMVLTDRTGILLNETHYRYALGGAILAELILQGRVELEPGTGQHLVTVAQPKATGDPVLDDALVQLVNATRRTNPEVWVGRFAEHEELYLRVARQLCRKKALDEHEGRVRLIFRRTVYADLDPELRDGVMDRVRTAVFEDEPTDVRTAFLTAFAGAGDILVKVFDPEELIPRMDHIRNIVKSAVDLTEEQRDQALEAERAVLRATKEAVLSAEESVA